MHGDNTSKVTKKIFVFSSKMKDGYERNPRKKTSTYSKNIDEKTHDYI